MVDGELVDRVEGKLSELCAAESIASKLRLEYRDLMWELVEARKRDGKK